MAQLVARFVRNEEVTGSIPVRSTLDVPEMWNGATQLHEQRTWLVDKRSDRITRGVNLAV